MILILHLVAYATDQMGKWELSENLSDLTFKIFHSQKQKFI